MSVFKTNDVILNKYRIERLLGEGAFGEVYLVTHLKLDILRALKVLRREANGMGSSLYAEGRSRFLLESRLSAHIKHPHLIEVYDFDDAGGELFLAMEYAPGGSLQVRIDAVRSTGQLPAVEEAVRIAREVAEGLAALHQREVVHRDLKPNNILFDERNRAKLADLGLAQVQGGASMRSRLSSAEHHPGTPAYMSPEQESSLGYLPPASDVYALGLVLFELLVGRSYRSQRPGTRARSLRADVPTWLDDLLAGMLAKNPEQRPWDGAEVAEALARPAAEQQTRKFTGVIQLANGVPLEFCHVPTGKFQMGSADSDYSARDDEKPQHTVLLDEYWIGKYPVTNRQYQAFVSATGRGKPVHWQNGAIPQGKEDHPVMYITWQDACDFCTWVSKISGQPVRLPTEAEWEKAARGTDGRIYPWGNEEPTAQLAHYASADTAAVNSHPAGASPYGVLDMAGNVWEWTADWHDYYQDSPATNPTGPASGIGRVLRGGSWDDFTRELRSANRGWYDPRNWNNGYGFRCAR